MRYRAGQSSRLLARTDQRMTEHFCQWERDCRFPARFKVHGGGIESHYWFCARHYDVYIERQRCSPDEAWRCDAFGDQRYTLP